MSVHRVPPSPTLRTAAAVGLLIALPTAALFFAANALTGLPHLPVKLMDWLPNNLPNVLLNTGKELMVRVLNAISSGDVDRTAKIAEALIGTAVLVLLLMGASIVIFLLARRRTEAQAGRRIGLMVGAGLGLLLVALYFSLPQVQFERGDHWLADAAFILAVITAAGYAAGLCFDHLSGLPAAAADTTGHEQLNRRQFLVRVGGTTATLTVAGAVVSLMAGSGEESAPSVTPALPTPEPPVSSPVTAENFVPAPGTRPEYTTLEEHYRIDIVGFPPDVPASDWTLSLFGMVNTPREMTLADLYAMPAQDRIVTMACISNAVGGNLISTTKWTGVPLRDLLALAQPLPEATHIKITCADGFDEYVSLSVIRNDPRIMLTYAWDDRPLLQKHGFPLRIHIPNVYGMKQPKWITGIEFVSEWGEGYWVRRGWSASAHVRHTSVIDTVATESLFRHGGVTYVPVGGMAFAGDRGIRAVEISVDGGEWTPAVLKDPLGDSAWTLWRYDWPYAAGAHSFEVRCIDGDNAMQRAQHAPQYPDGATGLHRVSRAIP